MSHDASCIPTGTTACKFTVTVPFGETTCAVGAIWMMILSPVMAVAVAVDVAGAVLDAVMVGEAVADGVGVAEDAAPIETVTGCMTLPEMSDPSGSIRLPGETNRLKTPDDPAGPITVNDASPSETLPESPNKDVPTRRTTPV